MAANSKSNTTNVDAQTNQQDADAVTNAPRILKMSFADWKKTNGTVPAPKSKQTATTTAAATSGTIPMPNKQQQQWSQSKVAPPPLMSISLNNNCSNNFGPPHNFRPHTFGPAVNNFIGPPLNFHNFHNNCRNNFKPLEPPPFWEDMMSPVRQMPIQRPLPKWLPDNRNTTMQHKSRSAKPHPRGQKPKKTVVATATNETLKTQADEALAAAILMPPPPPPPLPGEKQNTKATGAVKKQKTVSATKQISPQQPTEWIKKPMPPPPIDEKDPGTKEERQRLWKEYRQAMKPFKNREFHNAKRCIQRLTKIPPNELDEKQAERLQKSIEFVAAHKAMLSVKHAERWVQKENPQGDNADSKTQIFVRKPISSFWEKYPPPQTNNLTLNSFHNNGQAKQYTGTGRAIKGGITATGTAVATAATVGVSNQPLPTNKLANTANFGYTTETAYIDQYYTEATSKTPYYCPGYGTHFVQGETLIPKT